MKLSDYIKVLQGVLETHGDHSIVRMEDHTTGTLILPIKAEHYAPVEFSHHPEDPWTQYLTSSLRGKTVGMGTGCRFEHRTQKMIEENPPIKMIKV